MELTTPRDRGGSFEPEIVKKRQTILADSIKPKIMGMYSLGMSLRDISSHIKEIYDTDISHTILSEVTDRVIPAIRLWQGHSLDPIYTITWLDAMYYKVNPHCSERPSNVKIWSFFCRFLLVLYCCGRRGVQRP